MQHAQEIHPGLWQGSWPPPGDWLARKGFNTLVLCAEEYQPPRFVHPAHAAFGIPGTTAANPWPGVEVIYAPNDDDFDNAPPRETLRLALKAGRLVATRLGQRRKVLVTCNQGKNRSGLVSALALYFHLSISGKAATKIVQLRRDRGLRNPKFCEMLASLRDHRPEAVPADPPAVQAHFHPVAARWARQAGFPLALGGEGL